MARSGQITTGRQMRQFVEFGSEGFGLQIVHSTPNGEVDVGVRGACVSLGRSSVCEGMLEMRRGLSRANQPNSLSKSLWVPSQTQMMVSPLRSPTARYCSLTRTDQMWS